MKAQNNNQQIDIYRDQKKIIKKIIQNGYT